MSWKFFGGIVFVLFLAGCVGLETPPVDIAEGENLVRFARHFEIYETDKGHQLQIKYDGHQYIIDVDSNHVDRPKLNSHTHVTLGSASSVACLSTTHASMFDRINAVDQIAGVGFANLIRNENTRALIEIGRIQDLGGEEDVDFELLVDLYPEAFLVYPFGGVDYGRFQEAGIPCIPICEYRELHPLGRAEWILAIGLISGNYESSLVAFDKIAREYFKAKLEVESFRGEMPLLRVEEVLDSTIQELDTIARPSVFAGSFTEGIWYAPPGNSFIGVFLNDSGARYLFGDVQKTGNVELQFEELFDKAYEVDWWGKVIYEEGDLTLDRIRADDERFAELQAFREKQVFYCNAAETDYFGDGVVEPHVILRDLIEIFYPECQEDYENVYFKYIK